jgi:hypothetical protein
MKKIIVYDFVVFFIFSKKYIIKKPLGNKRSSCEGSIQK